MTQHNAAILKDAEAIAAYAEQVHKATMHLDLYLEELKGIEVGQTQTMAGLHTAEVVRTQAIRYIIFMQNEAAKLKQYGKG